MMLSKKILGYCYVKVNPNKTYLLTSFMIVIRGVYRLHTHSHMHFSNFLCQKISKMEGFILYLCLFCDVKLNLKN